MILNEEKLFNNLIKSYGFYMEQYNCNGSLMWIALKNTDTGIYAVITSSVNMEETNAYYAKLYMESKNLNFQLHNIVFTEATYEKGRENKEYEKLVYSMNEDRILFYGASTEPIAKIIQSLRQEKVASDNRGKKSIINITNVLIGLNVIMFIISAILSKSISNIDTNVLVYLGAKVNFYIEQGEIYRLVTAMFLHGGLMHIVFNMYALYALGDLTEQTYGKSGYVSIYFISGITASILSYILSPAVSVGASGAIFGLLGAALVFGFQERDRIGKDFLTNIGSVVVLNVIIGFSQSNIDNAGHFGGLIGGIIIALIIRSIKRK